MNSIIYYRFFSVFPVFNYILFKQFQVFMCSFFCLSVVVIQSRIIFDTSSYLLFLEFKGNALIQSSFSIKYVSMWVYVCALLHVLATSAWSLCDIIFIAISTYEINSLFFYYVFTSLFTPHLHMYPKFCIFSSFLNLYFHDLLNTSYQVRRIAEKQKC